MLASMKKITLGLIMVFFSAVTMAEGKVVILDLQAAVLNTKAAQQQLATLEENEEYASLRTRYENLAADLERFQEDAQKNSMTWSEEKKQEKQTEAQTLRNEYERAVQGLQGARQQVMQAVMQQMGSTTQDVLAQLIEAEKIDLVLNSQSAFHASDEYDITDQVTEMIDKAN